MDKVVNSVKQIVEECDSMLRYAEDTEYLDVKGIAKTLTDAKNELSKLFDETPDKFKEIEMAKANVEAIAIRLEYYLSVRMDKYTERRKLRVFAAKMYDDVREACIAYAKENPDDAVGITKWGVTTNWALTFYSRANHIIFELSDDDENMIKNISLSLSKGEH